jgi:hypothetical protein
MPVVLDAPNVVTELEAIVAGLKAGRLVPYLAPETVLLESSNAWLPARPEQLIERLSKRVPIPGRLRKSLSGAAQYIETFRHRKVLRTLMCEAFAQPAVPSVLHAWLVSLRLPLIVDLGYDGATAAALAATEGLSWGQTQGVSRAESRAGQGVDWFASYDAAGHPCADSASAEWQTLLYKPLGSIVPVGNFLVSDADFVEVLTEIDVQTPIPPEVQARRAARGFVFLGCRFDTQHNRTWARQVMKRSAGPHCALIEGELTKNEQRFCEEQAITVLPASIKQMLAAIG